MDEVLNKFEAACDEDTPLMFRPFMEEAVRKLRRSLKDRMAVEFLLTDVDDSAKRHKRTFFGKHPEFSQWSRDVVFPVKRRRLT